MDIFHFQRGESPLLVSVPHDGRHVPEAIFDRFTEAAKPLADTDWHVAELYRFVSELGAGYIAANYSRYVIDLNRAPDNKPLYPGAFGTGLCPTQTFSGQPIYREGQELTNAEVRERVEAYWNPYHAAIDDEMERLKRKFGFAVLLDAHSIRSREPLLFQGVLPDLNFGTGGGSCCDPTLTEAVMQVVRTQEEYSYILNGRFTGGYITRYFGDPDIRFHAMQLEQTQINYMDENPPFAYLPEKAAHYQKMVAKIVQAMLDWRPA